MLHSLGKNKVAMLLVALLLSTCLMMGLFSAGVSAANPLNLSNMTIQFGDPDPQYPPTPPESLMDLVADGTNTYRADYTGTDSATFYPDMLALYVIPNTGVTITSMTGTGVQFVTYASDGTPSYSSTATINAGGFYTIQISTGSTRQIFIDASSGNDITLKFNLPKSSGTAPTAAVVNGYLPGVSQYATGNTYGCISTDGANSLADQDLVKTIRGNAGNLVSLGSSGYIQYELASPITNSDKHKWGIDFIVTGNPFNGNPEAGMVMVAEKDGQGNPGTWYRLAGSRHYEANTVMNTNVTYTKNVSDISVTYGGNTTTFGTNVNWWPLFAAKPTGENYGATSGVLTSKITNVSYLSNDSTITYYDRTVVADDATAGLSGANATNFYAFGYADVRSGSGFVNPYASLPSTGGGADGFDLAWAVNAAGQPVDLTGKDIYFVQVYTATVYNAGIFGETSTEVASLTAASNETNPVGTTNGPAVTVAGNSVIPGTTAATIPTVNIADSTDIAVAVDAGTNDSIYINSTNGTDTASRTFNLAEGSQLVRIIVQDTTGNSQPYIGFIKLDTGL